mmetsp:Transcript_27433/g.82046  ORF Transcript_27433/g.82046 Transcript_27433/m.82046 type:complete len:299 (-) Transcript_27433:1000-1896(-)
MGQVLSGDADGCTVCCGATTAEFKIIPPPNEEKDEKVEKGASAGLFAATVVTYALYVMQDRLHPGAKPDNDNSGGEGDYVPPNEGDYVPPNEYDYGGFGEDFDYGPNPMGRRLLNRNPFGEITFGKARIPFGDPGFTTDVITLFCIFAIFQSVLILSGLLGRRLLSKETTARLAAATTALGFVAMCYAFNAIRAQDRFGGDHKQTKKRTQESNKRAQTVSAFVFLQFVFSLVVAYATARLLAPASSSPKSEDTVVQKEPSYEPEAVDDPEESEGWFSGWFSKPREKKPSEEEAAPAPA